MRPPKVFNAVPFAYHQEIELEIGDLTNLGEGVGRVDGWVVMVPQVLPGELVRARVWKNHKNYSQADLVEVLRPSPDRVEPVCPLFGQCGGCQYQHLSYNAQLEWKRKQVEELLRRLGGIEAPEVEAPQASPREYGYRSKLTPHFGRPSESEGELPIGFLRRGQRRLVDVPQCPIATEAINERLPSLRAEVRERVAQGAHKRGGTLLLRDTPQGVVTDMAAQTQDRVGDLVFEFPAGEFFQNNPFILPLMVNYALEEACQQGVRYLVDTYCGTGVFALSGAGRFEQVSGVEISEKAVLAATANAARNGISNCTFMAASAEAIFAEINYLPAHTAVILDPPRDGCSLEFLSQLIQFDPRRIVYVSCDPATQARDIKILREGGYELKRVRPFDLFPQTRHIESVATLVRE